MAAHPEPELSTLDDDEAPELPDEVMREVPRGALALAGAAVGSLILAWVLIYVFVFLPRGMVG
jgi:hypothetical protein